MKISFGLLPDHPMDEILDTIEVADKLGFHACYGADETFHKDCFQIFAAVAHRTKNIILAPDVTHVILRDPTMVVQAMATLDEITGGRTELNYSIGNFAMLEQYGLQDAAKRSLSRMREAHGMMRTFLDEGVLDHEGEFYTCQGMFTSARPVQERMPIKIGAMRGPKSFEFAGEVTRRHAPGARLLPRGEPVRRRPRAHRRRAGRPRLERRSTSPRGASPACRRTGTRRASACGCWSRSTSRRCRSSRCSATASTSRQTQPIFDAFASGDVEKAIELTTPDLVEKLSFSGTPEDVVAQIKENVVPGRA